MTQPTRCTICSRELNVPEGDVASRDCGGDCLTCMAEAGDPDAIEALLGVVPSKNPEAGWPTSNAMINCDPAAVVALSLMNACDDAPYVDVDQSAGEKPACRDFLFWDRVKKERQRIAQWVVSGLDITGRAR